MAQEGTELAKASFGPTILLAIGKAYEGQAAIYLGGYFQGGLASLRQEGQSIKSKVVLQTELMSDESADWWLGNCIHMACLSSSTIICAFIDMPIHVLYPACVGCHRLAGSHGAKF